MLPNVSVWYAQELVCNACRHAFSTTLARGIHARRVPEVRDQILAGEPHHVRCPACNAIVDAHRDLAYTDFARHQWVHVSTPDQLTDWAATETYALSTFDRYMVGGPPAVAALASAFMVRVVFDLDELREKLAVWNADLDDGLIECAKLISLRERPAIAAADRRIRLRSVTDTDLAFAAVELQRPRVDIARWTVARGVIDDIERERSTWESRMPALFGRGFVSLDRYLRGA
jgi:hypothetical protein